MMKRFSLLVATLVLVTAASAFAGRDGSELMLQEQQFKRLQNERAPSTFASQEAQKMMDKCRQMMSEHKS